MKHFLFPLALIAASSASYGEVAIGVHASTNGLGANLTFGINENFNVRALVNTYDYDRDDSVDEVNYDFELDLSSFGAIVDWHPTGGNFHLSAGLIANGNEVNGTGRPANATVDIGNTTFNSSLAGTLEADVTYDSVAPYIGLGWSNSMKNQGLGFAVNIGIIYQGDADVELRSVGADASIAAAIQAELDAEEQEIEDDLDDYKFYPVVSAGVTYRF